MKNLANLSSKLIFLILVFLRTPWQNICSYICLALAIVNLKIVSKKILGLADLFKAQIFRIHETTIFFVIRKVKNLLFIIFQIMTPYLEGLNNSPKLTNVDFIPNFSRNYFPRKEGYWIPQAQFGLSDYSMMPSSESKRA